jgi:hypothetical protein
MSSKLVSILFVLSLVGANVLFVAAATPTLNISEPADNSTFTTKDVTVSGTAGGSNHTLLDTTAGDFAQGSKDPMVFSPPYNPDATPYDDFNDNKVSALRWNVTAANGIAASATGGKLRTSGTGTGPGFYSSSVRVQSTATVSHDISAYLDEPSLTGSGGVVAAGLMQDSSNLIIIGSERDPDVGPDVVNFITVVASGAQDITVLGKAQPGTHNLAVVYSGGMADCYIDGRLIGTKAVELSNPYLLIAVSVRDFGDAVDARWDNVVLDSDAALTLKTDYDDFDDNSLSTAKWTVTPTNGIGASETGGQLVTSGTATGSSYYTSRVWIQSTLAVTDRASVTLTQMSYSATGFVAAVGLVEDMSNFVIVGSEKDPAVGLNPVYFITTVDNGVQQITTFTSTPAGPHLFALSYSASSIGFSIDGQPLGTRTISLASPDLLVVLSARASGDTITARWDNATIDRPVAASFTSRVCDSGSGGQVLKNIRWNATTPAGSALAVQIRTSDDDNMASATAWTPVTNNQVAGLSTIQRHIQYKLSFTDDNGRDTPVFDSLTMTLFKPVTIVEVSINNGTTWRTATGTDIWNITLVLPEDATTILIRATDVLGDTRSAYRNITIDTTPPNGNIDIDGRAEFTINKDVTLTLNATDKYGVTGMMVSEDGVFTDMEWEDYSPTMQFTLSTGDGLRTIYVKYLDKNGLESRVYNASIILDTLPPAGTIFLDGGALYTRNTTVVAEFNASDPIGLDGMMVSTDQTFSGAEWVAFAAEKTVALAPGSGERTVYVKFRDAGGHVSQAFSDSILLDQSPPEVRLSCNGGTAYTRSANVTIELTATENYQAVSMQLGPGDAQAIIGLPWAPFSVSNNLTLPGGEGTKTISARLQDFAGNVGAANSTTIILDYTTPRTAMGTLAASSPRAKFEVGWSATDATSGVLWYDVQYMAGNGTWNDLLSHTNLTSTQFTGDDLDTYHFRARAQDRAGNLEDFPATVDNAITVKLPEPAVTIVKPVENKELAGKTTATGTCQKVADGRNVTRVEWRVDNGTWTATDGTINWSLTLDTTKLRDGKHTLQVRTYDGKHYSAVVERQFRVKNAKPSGFIPADGALLLVGGMAVGLALIARRRK